MFHNLLTRGCGSLLFTSLATRDNYILLLVVIAFKQIPFRFCWVDEDLCSSPNTSAVSVLMCMYLKVLRVLCNLCVVYVQACVCVRVFVHIAGWDAVHIVLLFVRYSCV